MNGGAPSELEGKRVLVVEDEWFIADEMRDALERCGATVVGPAPDVEAARELVHAGGFDCAVLDINLHGEQVFELARELKAKDQPFVFATGYGANFVPEDLSTAPRFEKPLQIPAFVRAVAQACSP